MSSSVSRRWYIVHIRCDRAAVGWGVRELAKKAGVTANTVARSRTGRMRSNRRWTDYSMHWKLPASRFTWRSGGPGVRRPRPLQRPAAKPPRRPRRSDRCGAECAGESSDSQISKQLGSTSPLRTAYCAINCVFRDGRKLPMCIYLRPVPWRSRKPIGTRWSRGSRATVGWAATVATMMFISIPQDLAASSCHVIGRCHPA